MESKDIINRIRYFRNEKQLSARELSLRLDKSDTYINKLESRDFNLPVSMLLEIIKELEITPDEFFADNYRTYNQDKEMANVFMGLSADSKNTIMDLMKRMK